ncbi:MocR-like pyridoxine biosynthesis transcription factor PdxR [Actinocorallia populi]|uniref:MocR-like pyridoxine biosynthesis transcription factor PdxR n=1 Tax=Actinocorallia populi TaxID=2079200 RepID=UPI000D08FE9F|nr:PLP-dependent aminotransferase family protein [Actinocorallia populi]
MPRPRADLPLHLDRDASEALNVQLSRALRELMRAGVLTPGERMPSSRALAAELGLSRTVVTEAYQQLYAEGWLEGRHGSGTFVVHVEKSGHAVPRRPPREDPPVGGGFVSRTEARAAGLLDLRPGAPWVHDVDRAAWKRAWRRAAAEHPPDDDPDPRGLPWLREVLAGHLRRARGMVVRPENLVITRGTGHGLDLVAALLAAGGRAGVEDPGYERARNILQARGAEVVPCPVDHEGVVVDRLPDGLRLLYTTPAHQYPLGGRLPIARRERLLAWARATGTQIVEDDYDAEFRYDVAPLPALHGLDPERVILLGTLSKTLTPDLGIGWIVATPELATRLAALRRRLVDRTGGTVQYTTAVLLENGDLDRHLRRMRLEYARRRALVMEHLGEWAVGDTAGLHVLLPLGAARTAEIKAKAASRGVLLEDLTRYTRGEPSVHGLMVGYGSVAPAGLRRGCEILAGLLREP